MKEKFTEQNSFISTPEHKKALEKIRQYHKERSSSSTLRFLIDREMEMINKS